MYLALRPGRVRSRRRFGPSTSQATGRFTMPAAGAMIGLFALWSTIWAQDASLSRIVDQPIQEYFHPSIPYTHLGTSYQPIGPGAAEIVWSQGQVGSRGPIREWLGMQHQLSDSGEGAAGLLDFRRCYPPWIAARFQPTCRSVYLRARGRGQIKLEIKSPEDQVLWQQTLNLADQASKTWRFPVPTDQLGRTRWFHWIAEPGSELWVDALGLEITMPELSDPAYGFLVSYAKLARCFSPETALVRDRGHWPPGRFDTVPATGMFCLATAAASGVGLVNPSDARAVLRKVQDKVATLPRAHGLLPHFVVTTEGVCGIAPGTEFSTIDTSLYYHGMILAAALLGDNELLEKLGDEIAAIDFEYLTNDRGQVLHGLRADGQTRLPSVWADWGGETALVALLRSMAGRTVTRYPTNHPGRVYKGVGFIMEIQSLFYPHFGQSRSDALTGANWQQARQRLLARQQSYFGPDSPAFRLGLYGLSAGEGFRGEGYVAQGVDDPDHALIHPHYLLMSAPIRSDAQQVYAVLALAQQHGFFPPWGLVENVRSDLSEYLPYQGSLNATFECLAAYHLATATTGRPNAIYNAATETPPLNRAIRIFYPDRRP